jgi:DNA polymerase-3 subunit gamma/tau
VSVSVKAEPIAAQPVAAVAAVTAETNSNLASIWQKILASLELPSTRMLLTQQGELVRLDGHRAVVRVAANWAAMVQSRLPLLEQATERALGQRRQVVLETGAITSPSQAPAAAPPPVAPAPTPAPAPAAQNRPAGQDLKQQAKCLADFFNGEVIEADISLSQ